MFREICNALKRVDVDYFKRMAVDNHKGFLWHVTLSYDKTASLKNSLDFCGFPVMRNITEQDLGHEERRYAKTHKRNVSKEPPKLCDMFIEGPTYLYTENLLFLLIHQSCTVTEVHEVCSFRHEQYLNDYLQYLQVQRGKSKLKIISSCCKSLGNNLAGEKKCVSNRRTDCLYYTIVDTIDFVCLSVCHLFHSFKITKL